MPFIEASSPRHTPFNDAGYIRRMHEAFQAEKHPDCPSGAGPVYQVVITVSEGQLAEQQLREVIAHKRGDLRSLCRIPPAHPGKLHVHLGARRVHDVLAALEGAGFEVTAVVTPGERLASHGCGTIALRAANPRASNL